MNRVLSAASPIASTIVLLAAAVIQPSSSQAASNLKPARSGALLSHQAASGQVGTIRYIYHGLGVQPPHQSRHAGRDKDPLFAQYSLQTLQTQKASIGFQDGTVLQLNQETNAVITSHVTHVSRGEVAEYLAPGTNHRVQTAAAVAGAIGTTYDVRISGGITIFVVLHGALKVQSTASGFQSVVVKSNHQTSVAPNQAPSPPSPVNARAVFAWTQGIPAPDLGEDIALDANGGQVLGFSSQRAGPGDHGHAIHINDGLLTEGWESAQGKTTNQTVTVGFFGGNSYRISDVIIDPAATYGDPAGEDLKDFAIRISSTGTGDADFTTIFHGTCKQADTLQRFSLPVPVRAKYIQLVALDNYGSSKRVAVAEWEVVATESLFGQPEGVAVDARGFIYVADTSSNRIDKLSPGGRIVAQWGTKGSGPGQLLAPEGVALDRSGDIYVADNGNREIVKLSPRGQFLTEWGSGGVNNGQFEFPRGVAVNSSGAVYVEDVLYTAAQWYVRIQKFSPSGKLLAAMDRVADAGSLPAAGGIVYDPRGYLWVADTGANTVLKVSLRGRLLATLGKVGQAPGQFNGPTDLAVDSSGDLYVADRYNSRVERIDRSGRVVAWGRYGSGPGQFDYPAGIATDNRGSLYVADTGNGRLQKLAGANGAVRAIWGKFATIPTVLGQPGGLAVDPHGNVYVTDISNDRIQERSPDGHVIAVVGYHGIPITESRLSTGSSSTAGLGQFWIPQGIAIDRHGEVYVADSGNCRIQELAPRGPIGAIGGICGAAPGQFSLPAAVAVDARGNIYVADTLNNRIVKLSPKGVPIWTVGKAGTRPGEFNNPEGIVVDGMGNVYVSNFGSTALGFDGRIEKLTSGGRVIATWGRADPSGQSRFAGPQGLAVDRFNNLYVADRGHNAVQKLSPTGRVLAVFELPGGTRAYPASVAVDGRGTIYVVDGGSQRIDKLAPTGELLGEWTS